jgi:outer membrane protein OmpA-like peptidoglycan-associated protein
MKVPLGVALGLVVALAGEVRAQNEPLTERVATLRGEIERTLAAIEERRLALAGQGDERAAEEVLGRLVAEVIFQPGDVSLGGDSRQRLAGVAEAMRRLGTPVVRVVGYSDRTGPASINAQLALNRADVVGGLFVEAGFPPERVEMISGLEAGLPLPVPTPDGVAEPRNRSARIFAGGG